MWDWYESSLLISDPSAWLSLTTVWWVFGADTLIFPLGNNWFGSYLPKQFRTFSITVLTGFVCSGRWSLLRAVWHPIEFLELLEHGLLHIFHLGFHHIWSLHWMLLLFRDVEVAKDGTILHPHMASTPHNTRHFAFHWEVPSAYQQSSFLCQTHVIRFQLCTWK